MEDSEPETIVIKNWPEKFSDILNEIGVSATPNEIGEGEVEKERWTSRCKMWQSLAQVISFFVARAGGNDGN